MFTCIHPSRLNISIAIKLAIFSWENVIWIYVTCILIWAVIWISPTFTNSRSSRMWLISLRCTIVSGSSRGAPLYQGRKWCQQVPIVALLCRTLLPLNDNGHDFTITWGNPVCAQCVVCPTHPLQMRTIEMQIRLHLYRPSGHLACAPYSYRSKVAPPGSFSFHLYILHRFGCIRLWGSLLTVGQQNSAALSWCNGALHCILCGRFHGETEAPCGDAWLLPNCYQAISTISTCLWETKSTQSKFLSWTVLCCAIPCNFLVQAVNFRILG